MIQKVTILVLAFVVFSLAQGPGARLSVSQNGINTAHDIDISRLIQKLKDFIKIPNVDQSVDGCHVTIENIKLTDIQMAPQIDVQPDGIFKFVITNLVVSMQASDWHVRCGPFKVGGSVDATISQTTVKATIAITVVNGHPKLSVTVDPVVIGDFHVRVHGNKFVDIILQLFKNKIKQEIEKGIHDGIIEGIMDQANKFLPPA
jgi:hypothetical protein